MAQLNIQATQSGPYPTDKHDMTTYDDDGNWWGGGTSKNPAIKTN